MTETPAAAARQRSRRRRRECGEPRRVIAARNVVRQQVEHPGGRGSGRRPCGLRPHGHVAPFSLQTSPQLLPVATSRCGKTS